MKSIYGFLSIAFVIVGLCVYAFNHDTQDLIYFNTIGIFFRLFYIEEMIKEKK